MSEFVKYGPAVPFGETEVELAAVEPIRDIAARDLFYSSRTSKISIADDWSSSRIAYSHYFPTFDEWDSQAADRFISAQLTEVPQGWNLAVNVRSYVLGERHSNKRLCYRMEAYGDQLLQAKKEVFLILGRSNVVIGDEGEPQEMVQTVRKSYERQMRPGDCEGLLVLLQRSARRARTLRPTG
jgi:hypothetical protein